jgi:hypothetical protein
VYCSVVQCIVVQCMVVQQLENWYTSRIDGVVPGSSSFVSRYGRYCWLIGTFWILYV